MSLLIYSSASYHVSYSFIFQFLLVQKTPIRALTFPNIYYEYAHIPIIVAYILPMLPLLPTPILVGYPIRT